MNQRLPGQRTPGPEDRQPHDCVGDLGADRCSEDDTGRPGPPCGEEHSCQSQSRRDQVDVCTEHRHPEDDRVGGPQEVDPRPAQVVGGAQTQQDPHHQPGPHDQQLPHPDGLTQVVLPDKGGQGLQRRREGAVDARRHGPRGLDRTGDGVRATGPRDRRHKVRVAPLRRDPAIGRVVGVVGRADRRGQQCEGTQRQRQEPGVVTEPAQSARAGHTPCPCAVPIAWRAPPKAQRQRKSS